MPPRSRSAGRRVEQLVPAERLGGVTLDADDVHQRRLAALPHRDRLFDVSRLGDHDPGARIGDHVLGLLERGRVVDRERSRAEVHRGGVGHVELRSVGEPAGQHVAPAQTETGQPGGRLWHPLMVPVPGQALPAQVA